MRIDDTNRLKDIAAACLLYEDSHQGGGIENLVQLDAINAVTADIRAG